MGETLKFTDKWAIKCKEEDAEELRELFKSFTIGCRGRSPRFIGTGSYYYIEDLKNRIMDCTLSARYTEVSLKELKVMYERHFGIINPEETSGERRRGLYATY